LFKRTFAFKNSKGKESVSFHIKLDTGMHRLGFEDDSNELIATLKGNETVKVKYVASGQSEFISSTLFPFI
jgi:alanine racemase